MEAAREDGVDEIRASGGLVVRDGRVVVVHRPEYDDWSFPKGKADPGESDEDCALREIEEETGLRCELGEELTTTRHRDTKGTAEARALVADAAPAGGIVGGVRADGTRSTTCAG